MQTLTYRHYDSGFDPRFTLDGLSFDIDRYPPTGIVKRIQTFIAALFNTILESLHLSKSSQFKKLLKATIEAERSTSDSLQKRLFPNLFWAEAHYDHVFFHDNEFFEYTGNLFNALVQEGRCKPSQSLPALVFPAVLLRGLYYINAPQGKEDLRKNLGDTHQYNGDLARCTRRGFSRLQIPHPHRPLPHLVDHISFIDATAKAADELKLKTREWRLCLIDADAALKAGKSEEEIKATVVQRINAFYEAWMNYVNSHEVLSEVYEVLSEKNFHKQFLYTLCLENPATFDFITHIKSLWYRYDRIEEDEKAYNDMKEAFFRRAKEVQNPGKINKTAILFQYTAERGHL